jgi:hypothetical protein
MSATQVAADPLGSRPESAPESFPLALNAELSALALVGPVVYCRTMTPDPLERHELVSSPVKYSARSRDQQFMSGGRRVPHGQHHHAVAEIEELDPPSSIPQRRRASAGSGNCPREDTL